MKMLGHGVPGYTYVDYTRNSSRQKVKYIFPARQIREKPLNSLKNRSKFCLQNGSTKV